MPETLEAPQNGSQSLSEHAEWIDGPALCAWLEQRGVILVDRRAVDWRKGSTASVYKVDELLVAEGLHLHELPEWMWVHSYHANCERDMTEIELACKKRMRMGQFPSAVARSWDIPKQLCEAWAKELGLVFVASGDIYGRRRSR